jgi:hypothetical protein
VSERSDALEFLNFCIARGAQLKNSAIAGRLRYFYDFWRNLTSDAWLLDKVTGIHVDFDQVPIPGGSSCSLTSLSASEAAALDTEIATLIHKAAVVECAARGVFH